MFYSSKQIIFLSSKPVTGPFVDGIIFFRDVLLARLHFILQPEKIIFNQIYLAGFFSSSRASTLSLCTNAVCLPEQSALTEDNSFKVDINIHVFTWPDCRRRKA
jgi:hypothetical protein